jgi:hypothetical protein
MGVFVLAATPFPSQHYAAALPLADCQTPLEEKQLVPYIGLVEDAASAAEIMKTSLLFANVGSRRVGDGAMNLGIERLGVE